MLHVGNFNVTVNFIPTAPHTGTTWYCTRSLCFGAHTGLCCPSCSRAQFVCTTVGLAPCADAHDHRALPCPAPSRAPGASPAAPAPRNCPSLATLLGAHAREPTQWPHAGDRYHATHRALLPTRLPSYADYILRLQDTEPESLGIMLRLLLVALPLVVALPAAFDKQEVDAQQVDALQIEVQAPLQFEVRSPPKSRPLRPAATRDQHDCPATTHSTPHARHPPSAHITTDAPRRTGMRARRSTPRSTSSPTSSQPRDTPTIHRCAPSPAGRHACGAASVGPTAARARPVCMLQAHAHEAARARCPLPRLPDSVDSAPAEA